MDKNHPMNLVKTPDSPEKKLKWLHEKEPSYYNKVKIKKERNSIMPDITTHYLFGEEVQKQLPSSLQQLIQQKESIFACGTQGADILFYRKSMPGKNPIPYYASLIHKEKTDQVLLFWKQYLNSKKNTTEYPILSTYYMGFLCHYFLDSTVHPYVYYLTERRRGQKGYSPNAHTVHAQIEAEIDSIFYRLMRSKPITSFPVKEIFTIDHGSKTVIAKGYTELLSHVFGINAPIGEIIKSFDDFVLLSSLLFHKQGLVKSIGLTASKFYQKADAIMAHTKPEQVLTDTANFCENPWYHPQNHTKKSTQSVLNLFQEAVKTAGFQISQIYETMDSSDTFPFAVTVNFAGNDITSSNQ
jgi:hypothetical protein